MINKFSELIKQGIAPSPYNTNTFGETSTGTSNVCRLYNNIWGSVSGTCMAYKEEENKYVITGSIMRQPELWDKFLHAENWGLYVFKQAVSYNTLQEFFDTLKLQGNLFLQNNDPVYVLTAKI